jgi:hypothetical protein
MIKSLITNKRARGLGSNPLTRTMMRGMTSWHRRSGDKFQGMELDGVQQHAGHDLGARPGIRGRAVGQFGLAGSALGRSRPEAAWPARRILDAVHVMARIARCRKALPRRPWPASRARAGGGMTSTGQQALMRQ